MQELDCLQRPIQAPGKAKRGSGVVVYARIWLYCCCHTAKAHGRRGYLISTLRGKAKPNIVSWSLWSLTALIAFAAQIYKGGGSEALVTLAIAFGPLAVIAVAVLKGAQSLTLTRLDVAIQPGWLAVRELGSGAGGAAWRAWFLIFCSRPGVSW